MYKHSELLYIKSIAYNIYLFDKYLLLILIFSSLDILCSVCVSTLYKVLNRANIHIAKSFHEHNFTVYFKHRSSYARLHIYEHAVHLKLHQYDNAIFWTYTWER